MIARPYPWSLVPRVPRAAAASRSAVRDAFVPEAAGGRVLASLEELAGWPVKVKVDSAGRDAAATLVSQTVAVRFASPGAIEEPGAWWLVLEVEIGFVVDVVSRVTKRAAPTVIHPGTLTPTLLGAFVAIAATAARRAGIPATAAPVDPDVGLPTVDVSVAGLTVDIDGSASRARAFFPTPLLAKVRTTFGASALASLGALPLTLPLVACRVVATVSEVAALGEGDVCMLDAAWTLGRAGEVRRGRAWLCAAAEERAVPVDLEGDARIVLREGVEELGWSPMSQDNVDGSALVAAVGDVPVVVRVEVGAATMKAREWSALQPGDVVGLGGRIGDPVTLRVSGLAVAEGELVDLEGEVGVRIRRRLAT